MTEKKHPFETEGLFSDLEKLLEEAEIGNFEAKQRVEAIKKLANPIFSFSPTDYQRILNKKLPLPVKKGIQLFKMMKELTYLVQPKGKKKGSACFVRRVDYENLTWEEFLEVRGFFSAEFIFQAMKQRTAANFNGLEVLNEKQKSLYRKIGIYFGEKKKPTLQSLAINLLNEETNGEDFSERSLYIYLNAVKEYRIKRQKASGFEVLNFTFDSVILFNNGDERTVRESVENWDKTFVQLSFGFRNIVTEASFSILQGLEPQFFSNLMPNVNLFQDIFKSSLSNYLFPNSIVKKKTKPS